MRPAKEKRVLGNKGQRVSRAGVQQIRKAKSE